VLGYKQAGAQEHCLQSSLKLQGGRACHAPVRMALLCPYKGDMVVRLLGQDSCAAAAMQAWYAILFQNLQDNPCGLLQVLATASLLLTWLAS